MSSKNLSINRRHSSSLYRRVLMNNMARKPLSLSTGTVNGKQQTFDHVRTQPSSPTNLEIEREWLQSLLDGFDKEEEEASSLSLKVLMLAVILSFLLAVVILIFFRQVSLSLRTAGCHARKYTGKECLPAKKCFEFKPGLFFLVVVFCSSAEGQASGDPSPGKDVESVSGPGLNLLPSPSGQRVSLQPAIGAPRVFLQPSPKSKQKSNKTSENGKPKPGSSKSASTATNEAHKHQTRSGKLAADNRP
ncbi:hypothetical protein B0H13DRAFT_2561702 [Mycena leptocephala]|nr:hypothetical protein B0H13DRAFT_2561702 [Mycena leptocephala]